MPNTLQLAFAGSFVGTISLLVALARALGLPPFASSHEHTITEPKNQLTRSLVAVANTMGIDATQLMAIGVGAVCTCTALYFLSSKRMAPLFEEKLVTDAFLLGRASTSSGSQRVERISSY